MFFDNLAVMHYTGPVVEETHYYPFGLTMAGISSKAFGKLDNKYKYNGIELNEEFEIDIYNAFYRNLDPQTGRWWQIDPKMENMETWSPYASNYDNPILYSDHLGDEGEACCKTFFKELWDDIKDATVETAKAVGGVVTQGADWINDNINPLLPWRVSVLPSSASDQLVKFSGELLRGNCGLLLL